jgi:hypothetical protein
MLKELLYSHGCALPHPGQVVLAWPDGVWESFFFVTRFVVLWCSSEARRDQGAVKMSQPPL